GARQVPFADEAAHAFADQLFFLREKGLDGGELVEGEGLGHGRALVPGRTEGASMAPRSRFWPLRSRWLRVRRPSGVVASCWLFASPFRFSSACPSSQGAPKSRRRSSRGSGWGSASRTSRSSRSSPRPGGCAA